MKLLIIEDEIPLLQSIKTYFKKDGFVCESAVDFSEGLDKVEMYEYDCVIVDLNLPKGNGMDIVKSLKTLEKNTGIVIISAIDDLDSKITGFNVGSDDYLTKPFHLAELNARVKAVIRRRQFSGKNLVLANEITIHPEERKVLINDKLVKFTKIEYQLLLYFISNRNRVVTKNMIAEHLWGDYMEDYDSLDFVYSHIKNLRKKLVEHGCEDHIETIYGIGYKFRVT